MKKEIDNTLYRALLMYEVVQAEYVPGQHSHSHNWVWKNRVRPLFGISINTYYRYLRLAREYKAKIKGN